MTTQAIPFEADGIDLYRPVFDLSPQPMWVCDARISRFLVVNAAAVDQYGYSAAEFQSMNVETVFSPESIEGFSNCCRRFDRSSAGTISGIWRHRTKGGQTFCVEMKIRSIAFNGHRATLVVAQDVTARLRDDRLLSARHTLARIIDEDLPDVLSGILCCLRETLGAVAAEWWALDKNSEYLCRRPGGNNPGLDTSVPSDAAPADSRVEADSGDSTLARVMAGAEPGWIGDLAAEPGYRERAVAMQSSGIGSAVAFGVRGFGAVVLLVGDRHPPDPPVIQLLLETGWQLRIALERRKIREELGAREETFRTFLDEAPFAYHEVDNNGIFVSVNRAECELLGLNASEIVGRPVWDLATSEERDESRAALLRAIEQRGAIPPFQRKRQTPGGESVFSVHPRLIFTPAGEVAGIRTVMLDLTESSHARQRIELQTNLLDQITDAVLTVDRDFRIRYFNGAAERLFGWHSREAMGQPYSAVAGTVVTQAERKAIHADIFNRGSWTGEIICTNRQGRQFVVNVSWSVLRDRGGTPMEVVGIHRDLTAPKQMEQALRESEDRLKLAQSALSLGTWEVDFTSETVLCSERLLQLYGIFEPRERMSFEEWNRIVHPEDRPAAAHGAKALFRGAESFDRQLRVMWPDGSVHWLHSKSRVIFDDSGQARRAIGVDFDITGHKQTEERLRILSSAVEQCPVSILISNLNDEIEYVNARLTESTGYTLEELKGHHARKLSGAMPPEHFQEIGEAIQTGQWQGVVQTTRKSGERFWESVFIRPIRDAQGKPTHLIAVAEDITERLEMESALKLSEERFRIAAESSGDSIYEWDLRSDLVTVLGTYQPYTEGLAAPPWRGGEFRRRFYHPDDFERVEAAIQRSLADGEPFKQEYRIVLPSGENRYYADQGSAVRDASGRPYKWIGASRDITDQKKVERANAQLAAIVENADAAIISQDLTGAVLTWNRGAERLYGYSAEEMIGQTMAALVPSDKCAEDATFMKRLRRGERIQHVETMRLAKSGEPTHVLLTLSPMQDRQGNFLGIAHVAEDISHVKELERQLAQTQKLESIGQLAAGIAHEINTPIQYIGDNGKFLEDAFRDLVKFAEARRRWGQEPVSGSDGTALPTAEMLDEGVFDYLRDEVPKAIEQLLEGVDRVARIVLAMKEFSHPGPAEKTPVDINRAIESTVLVSKNEWKYLAELTTDFDHELPSVHCLAGEFNQVILNLIVNAAHAISDVVKDTGNLGKIHLVTRREGTMVEIRVSDTGCGIPKAHQSKVFDPFFTTKPVGKGTGQGLAIAYGVIVQKHGGSIHLESEPGSGTTFIIRLPLALEMEAA